MSHMENHTENTVENPVNKKRLVDTFLKLVSIDSESYHERKMADFLKKELKSLGLHVEEDDAAEKLAEHYARTAGKGKTGEEAEKIDPAGNLWTCLPGNLPSEEENRKKALLFS